MTPFDNLAIKLIDAGMRSPTQRDEKRMLCQTFLGVCRVKYLQMFEVSSRFWKMHEESFKTQSGTRTLTYEEMLIMNTDNVEARLNYFGFIEELNRFGRVFEEKYSKTLPLYSRIRFYRNKMIEHWDDYEGFLQAKGNGLTYSLNKLVIPHLMGSIHMPAEEPQDHKILESEFQACGITLPPIDLSKMYAGYAEIIYPCLEQIDPTLGKKIPDNLVNALFKYTFPTPIHDLEAYNNQLIAWLDAFLTT